MGSVFNAATPTLSSTQSSTCSLRKIPKELYVALQWRLEPLADKRNDALSRLVGFITGPRQLSDQLAQLVQRFPTVHAELMGRNDV